MKLFDALLGKTQPIKANLDALFAMPTAAITLQTTAGVVPTGRAGVCFKAPAGQSFADSQHELDQLLSLDTPDNTGTLASEGTPAGSTPAPGTFTVRHVEDNFGYRWIVLEADGIEDLVTRVHMVHSTLADAGWDTQLLCSVFGFTPGSSSDIGVDVDPDVLAAGANVTVSGALYLVYLAKRGTFYPFAPTGPQTRATELELRIKAVLGSDLPVEPELDRWFPLWDLPIA